MSDSVIPWTASHQAAPSMGFSRQEHWSGLPFSSPGDLLHPGIKPKFLALQADSLLLSHKGSPTGAEILLNYSLRGINNSGMRTEGREEIETVLKRKHDKIWQMMSCEKKG